MNASVDQTAFRDAMAKFAGGVTVVTTSDENGRDTGFTASAFSSLSLDPPLLLVCLQKDADCYSAFDDADAFAVSILSAGQRDIALRFATKGADKLEGTRVLRGEATGLALVEDATAFAECRVHERMDGGDHVILIGRVVRASVNGNEPLVHFDRRFGRFVAEDET